MTMLDLVDGEAVRAELSCPADLAAIALLLPEQEWCAQCVLDETSEPGVPRDVARSPSSRHHACQASPPD
jgi:hypothetical protein